MVGLSGEMINTLNWEQAVSNIVVDVRSDFILSPHFDVIYLRNSEQLIEHAKRELRSGNYTPRLPITFSVPKSNFLTRPGSILEPKDRLIHQALIEISLEAIENQLDRTRSFSQMPSQRENELFEPTHLGWDRFREATTNICNNHPYVLKADVANYFETIPQHTVINLLTASGLRAEYVNLIEEQLLAFRERSSTGIVQGIYPSDLLGNFYLSDFDADCDLHNLHSARYVDDIFIGFNSELQAKRELVRLTERLRKNGLAFNPQKTEIVPSNRIVTEEQELDQMFDNARDAIADHLESLRQSGYGFQGDWINEEQEIDEVDIDLEAVKLLLNYENASPNQKEKIERFCLPILRGADDNSAVASVIDNFFERPQLTRIYSSYLNHFTHREPEIVDSITTILERDEFHCDYQRMYMIAAVLNCEEVNHRAVRKSLQWLESMNIGPETRALCAIFAAKFGTANQKRAVRVRYDNEPSEYVRAAILFSAQYFPLAEKRTAKRAWGGQSQVNAFINDVI